MTKLARTPAGGKGRVRPRPSRGYVGFYRSLLATHHSARPVGRALGRKQHDLRRAWIGLFAIIEQGKVIDPRADEIDRAFEARRVDRDARRLR